MGSRTGRIIGLVPRLPIGSWDEVPVDIDYPLDGGMTKLAQHRL